ncbi:MAG: hypothetical protein V4479_02300 [Actinomycetota bacterium]
MSDIRDDARAGFREVFGHDAGGVWSAPGTVRSLSLAVDRRVVIALGLRDDRLARIANAETGDVAELDLAELDIVRELGVDLDAVPGFDLMVVSDVPDALDPSGALESALALALNDVWQLNRPAPAAGEVRVDGLVLIMDMGRPDSALETELAIDTATAAGVHRAWMDGGVVLALVDPGDLSRVLVSIDGAFAEHGLAQPNTFAVSAGFGARREPNV